MNDTQINRVAGYRLSVILLLGLVGCAPSPKLIKQVLDPVTAVTVTTSITPLLFYRDNPSRAAYARNFLNLGPIEVNRSGSYRYYIWIGAWSTQQTDDPVVLRDSLESVIVFADDEPLKLEVSGWSPEILGTKTHPYLRPVADAIDAYYLVTLDQIDLLAEAKNIRLRTSGSSPRDYDVWDDQRAARQSLDEFVVKAAF